MRKMNKLVAVAILAAIATFSVPQSAKAGIILTDRSAPVTDNTDKSGVGVVMGDFVGIIITDFSQALTGIMLSD